MKNNSVKDAAQVRLVTSAGTISAKVVKVDAANDLALLKADGRFAPLPIISSRAVKLGGTVATVGFPDPGLQGFAPKVLAHGHHGGNRTLSTRGMTRGIFRSERSLRTAIKHLGKWQDEHRPLVDAAGNVVGIVPAKLNAAAALAMSGSVPENVNYAIKSSFLLSFLESVPGVLADGHHPEAHSEDGPIPKFEDVVKSAQDAAVLVLVIETGLTRIARIIANRILIRVN